MLITEAKSMETDKISQSGVLSIKRSMYRMRRKTQPKIPKTKQETLTALTSKPLQHGTATETNFEANIVCIYDPKAIGYIEDTQELFGDGTFRSCPKEFYQIYTIIAHKNGNYIPVAFFLLPGKSMEIYIAMFQMFQKIYFQVNGAQILNKILHLDFEKAAHDAAKNTLTGITVKGCLFHLKQNWFRKIQELGLASDYKDPESEVGTFLKLTFGLPFLDYLEIYDSMMFLITTNL